MTDTTDRTESVFAAAVALATDGERAAYLDQACASDAGLRRHVEALLRAHARAEHLLDRPVPGGSEQTGAYHAREQPGTVFANRYKLLEQIGEGGMGDVWVADQLEPIKRRVAIKLIKAGMDSRSVLGRFEAERQALAVMDHPNIAKVLDAGSGDDGRPYFVMELVKGTPITEFCDLRKLSTKQRLELFIPVCKAIQHAHMKGIIHRDIKPSNVLVALHDETPVPKVIDFGVAKAIGQQLTEKTIYTGFGALIGTPTYMAPEQATFNQLDVDTRADVYALGVLLYELLTGSPPIESNRLKKAALEEVLRIVRDEEPQRPSQRLSTSQAKASIAATRQSDPSKLTALMRGDLDWIVMKALEKDRTRRYETANGLAMDLHRHLANEPVIARPPSALYRFQKMARRNRLVFGATVAVVTVLVVGMLASTWLAVRATRAEVEQARQRQIAEDNERIALDAQLREANQRENADEQRQKAVSQELVARQQAYAADMNLANQSLAINNLGRAQALLNRHRPQLGQHDLRGLEWRYLWGQCQSDAVARFPEITGLATSVAVSPDGKWITTGNRGRPSLAVFDWESKKKTAQQPGIVSGLYVAFSPLMPLVAFPMSAKGKHSVRLWDVEKQHVVKDLPLGSRSGRLAFSADGRTLVTTTEPPDSKLTLWRVPEGEPIRSLPIGPIAPSGEQIPLAIARDLSVMAYAPGGRRNAVEILDLSNGKVRWTLSSGEAQTHYSLALSPDGKTLAAGSSGPDPQIRLWDVATGRPIGRPVTGHRAWISELLFWPDGKTLASSSADQTVRLWDMTDPDNVLPIRTLQGHKHEVWSLALMPDNRHLLSGSKDAELLVWDTADARGKKGSLNLSEKLTNWQFAPDGKSLVTLNALGRVARRTGHGFQESTTLVEVGPIELGVSGRSSINLHVISPDCRLAAIGSTTGSVQVWDLEQRKMLRKLSVGKGNVAALGVLPKTQKLFVYSENDSRIREWDMSDWHEAKSWATSGVYPCFAATIDEQRLILGQGGAWELLLEPGTGRERRLNRKTNPSFGISFSSNGKLLAEASPTGFVKLWELETASVTLTQIHTFDRCMLGAHSVAFSPDGKRLAAGSSGHESVRLWDIESKQELLVLDERSLVSWKTDFSPDGNVLGSLDSLGVLRLWIAPSWEEIAAAETKKPDTRE